MWALYIEDKIWCAQNWRILSENTAIDYHKIYTFYSYNVKLINIGETTKLASEVPTKCTFIFNSM